MKQTQRDKLFVHFPAEIEKLQLLCPVSVKR